MIIKKVTPGPKQTRYVVEETENYRRWYRFNTTADYQGLLRGHLVLHRENGPAVEYVNGEKHYFINGQKHREDGPAAELYDGTKMWFKNNKSHRDDGPAIEWGNGKKEWWTDGKLIRSEEPEEKSNSINPIENLISSVIQIVIMRKQIYLEAKHSLKEKFLKWTK